MDTMQETITDPFGRHIEYVRLSVTDRCDLRCSYCLPKGFRDFEEPDQWLNFDEIEKVMRAFTELGVRRIRLTGGEPLSRGRIADLAARIAGLPGLEDLSLSTNATRLKKLAGPIKAAGVTRLNVSLDSLDPARFAEITGGGRLEQVLDGLRAARAAGFEPIKINMVVMKGVNDDEIGAMVRFCIDQGFTLRFIETMPVGDTGRAATEHYLDLQEVRRALEREFTLVPSTMNGGRSRHPAMNRDVQVSRAQDAQERPSRDTDRSVYGGGPARYYRVAGTELRIGFITPISQHFCATCNRVRLTVDGTLYTCLGQDDQTELRPLLRAGASLEELKQAIRGAIARKPERHEFVSRPEQVIRFMSYTGG
jgi:cyclic pyranopterin phosphate synthase